MRWASLVLLAVSLYAASSYSDRVERILSTSSRLIESGQPAEALQRCREAQVEHPHSVEVLFVMGCAQSALGDRLMSDGKQSEAAAQFREARSNFARSSEEEGSRLREGGRFNAATCLLHLDATFNPNSEYENRIENLSVAVEELATMLDAYPNNERVRKNLDYARYRLALLLQRPPQEEESPDEQKKDDDPEGTSEVVDATTQLPNASADVVDGSTVVLRFRSLGGDAP